MDRCDHCNREILTCDTYGLCFECQNEQEHRYEEYIKADKNKVNELKQRLKDAEEILSNYIEINYKEATVLESDLSKICREYFKKHGGGCG